MPLKSRMQDRVFAKRRSRIARWLLNWSAEKQSPVDTSSLVRTREVLQISDR